MTSPSRQSRLFVVLVVALAALGADLATKAWAWATVRHQPIIVSDGLLHFEFGFNTGAAFGVLRDASWGRGLFFVVAALAIAYLGRIAFTLPRKSATPFVAIGLIMGGVLGNLHDRLFRTMETLNGIRHGVVDFVVVFYWPDKRWPAFNVADAALVVGVALFMLAIHRAGAAPDSNAESPPSHS